MTSKNLAASVIAIGICIVSAYILLSPLAQRAQRAESERLTQSTNDQLNRLANVREQDDDESTSDDDNEREERGEREQESDTGAEEFSKTAPVTSNTPQPPVNQQLTGYTLQDVAQHSDASSCWSAIGNTVYDLTSFIARHPGGEKRILKLCGTDGTSAFEGQHGGDTKPEQTLARHAIGTLIQ